MFKKIVLSTLMAVGVVASAMAQAWQPTKPVEAVMAWTPGSANEIIFRVLAKQVEANNPGVKFIVNNRPGASGVVGTEYFSKLPADGHSLTVVSVPGITAMDKVAVPDPSNRTYTTDTFVYPLLAASSNFVFITHPRDTVNTPEQLIQALKTEKSTFDALGGARLAYETLSARTRFPQGDAGVVRIEHRGPAETLNAIAGGHVRFAVTPVSVAYQFIQDGRVKAIALSGNKTLKQLPNVRLMSSVLPGFNVPAGWGLMLHKNTPPEAVTWYQNEFTKALRSEEVRTIFENNLFQDEPTLQTAQSFGSYIRQLEKQYQPLVDNILKQINNK
jgi:tripartite-type tricarboxylate transporter receptor subunit TctC